MAINNSTNVKDLVDAGMEEGLLDSEEISDFLLGRAFPPNDAEDGLDFLSESDIDIVETIQEKVGPRKEERRGRGRC